MGVTQTMTHKHPRLSAHGRHHTNDLRVNPSAGSNAWPSRRPTSPPRPLSPRAQTLMVLEAVLLHGPDRALEETIDMKTDIKALQSFSHSDFGEAGKVQQKAQDIIELLEQQGSDDVESIADWVAAQAPLRQMQDEVRAPPGQAQGSPGSRNIAGKLALRLGGLGQDDGGLDGHVFGAQVAEVGAHVFVHLWRDAQHRCRFGIPRPKQMKPRGNLLQP